MSDTLTAHEAFLRAIFDAPDDDTPRLVYADFLEEHADDLPTPARDAAGDRAEFIRVQCALARLAGPDPEDRVRALELGRRERELRLRLVTVSAAESGPLDRCERGFPPPRRTAVIDAADLREPTKFRTAAVTEDPGWFGVTAVRVTGGPVSDPGPIDILLSSPALARVTDLDLRGGPGWVCRPTRSENPFTRNVAAEYILRPTVAGAAVAAVAEHPGAARLTTLGLTYNSLTAADVEPLLESEYLTNLRRLELLVGNRLDGRVWRRLIDRFGADVVG